MKYYRILSIAAFLCLAPALVFGNVRKIAKVHAGDLIELEGGFTAHLTGITVPDKSTKLGFKVYDFTKRELEGKVVKVFTYTTNDQASGIVYGEDGLAFMQIVYGSSIGHEKGEINFNELLLKMGYAKVNEKYLPDDLKHFKDLELEAKANKLGMWGE